MTVRLWDVRGNYGDTTVRFWDVRGNYGDTTVRFFLGVFL